MPDVNEKNWFDYIYLNKGAVLEREDGELKLRVEGGKFDESISDWVKNGDDLVIGFYDPSEGEEDCYCEG